MTNINFTKQDIINNLNSEIESHKNALDNMKTTSKCIVVVVHTDFGSGEDERYSATIGLEDDGETTKYIPYTTAEDVVSYTIGDAKKVCKTKLRHEKTDIEFTYSYELVDIKTWHQRQIESLEDTLKFLNGEKTFTAKK